MYENKIILEILNLQIFYYHSTIIMWIKYVLKYLILV
jgi:hypothetical protein